MLCAYVDESVGADPPIFVMAGYIAPAESWAAFSHEWREALDELPALAYFKMSEAHSRTGEFEGVPPEIAVYRMRRLRAIIEKYVLGEFSFVVEPPVLREVLGERDRWGTNPFFLGAHELMMAVARQMDEYGIPIQRVDFVFDERMREAEPFIEAWEKARDFLQTPAPLDLFQRVPGLPQFANDKDVLPLQAADIVSWWWRRRYLEAMAGLPKLGLPWEVRREIRGPHIYFDRKNLLRHFDYVSTSGDVSFQHD